MRKNKRRSDDQGSTLKYPYAKWMLEEIKSQYAVENERENKISAKASAFITVNLAIITLYIPIIPFENLRKFWNLNTLITLDRILVIVALVVLFIGFGFLIFAFRFLIKAYGVKGYKRVNIDDLIKIASITGDKKGEAKSQTAQGMAAHYYEILRGTLDEDGNMETNTKSADSVAIGIRLTVIGLVLLSIATIALRITVVI